MAIDIDKIKSEEYLCKLCKVWLELQQKLTNETNDDAAKRLVNDISLYSDEIAVRLIESLFPKEYKAWLNNVYNKLDKTA